MFAEPAIVPVSNTQPYRYIKWDCEGPNVAKGEARAGIIAHNSVHAGLKAGKKVIFSDDCPPEKAPEKDKPKPTS